ncbi:hypothetical protein Tco_0607940 [Tanacetum coccineum]
MKVIRRESWRGVLWLWLWVVAFDMRSRSTSVRKFSFKKPRKMEYSFLGTDLQKKKYKEILFIYQGGDDENHSLVASVSRSGQLGSSGNSSTPLFQKHHHHHSNPSISSISFPTTGLRSSPATKDKMGVLNFVSLYQDLHMKKAKGSSDPSENNGLHKDMLVKLTARVFYDDITAKGDNQPKSGRSDNCGIAVVVLDALTRFFTVDIV